MPIDDRPTLAAPDDDPYLWLEDIEGERALGFVEQQNKRTLEKFADAGFAADPDTLAAIYDRPEAKSSTAWLEIDTLLLTSAYGEGMATTSGYARTVRLWRRGADVDRAPVIFETAPDNMAAFSEVDRTDGTPRVWFGERLDFFNTNLWLGSDAGARLKIDLPTDAQADFHRGWFAVRPRKPWTIGPQTYAPDTVLGMPLPAFLAGERNFEILCEPGPRRAVQHFFWANGKLVI